MATKRKVGAMAEEDESVDPSDQLLFLNLGGGCEVGRSCHILQYKGKTIMVSLLTRTYNVHLTIISSLMLVCIPLTMASLLFLSSTSLIYLP